MRTYFIHKDRRFLKLMMIISTTGYILEIFDSYFADGKNNDVNILKTALLKKDTTLLDRLWPGDVMVIEAFRIY